MDGFELNKVFAAILIALLVGKVSGMIGHTLIAPHPLEKSAYPIEGVEVSVADTSAPTAESEKIAPIEPLLATASVEEGKKIAIKCLQCHTLGKGEHSKIGPNLWEVVNRKVAHVADYAYSKAMQSVGGDWTVENLNHFLHKPSQYVKGTKMTFAGLKKDQDRANLIAYLKTLS